MVGTFALSRPERSEVLLILSLDNPLYALCNSNEFKCHAICRFPGHCYSILDESFHFYIMVILSKTGLYLSS